MFYLSVKSLLIIFIVAFCHFSFSEYPAGTYQTFYSSKKNFFNPLKSHFYSEVFQVNQFGQVTGQAGISFLPQDPYIRREGAMPPLRRVPGQNLPVEETLRRDLALGRQVSSITVPISNDRYQAVVQQSQHLTVNPPYYRGLFNQWDPNASNCRRAIVEFDGRHHVLGGALGYQGAVNMVNDAQRNGYVMPSPAPVIYQWVVR